MRNNCGDFAEESRPGERGDVVECALAAQKNDRLLVKTGLEKITYKTKRVQNSLIEWIFCSILLHRIKIKMLLN